MGQPYNCFSHSAAFRCELTHRCQEHSHSGSNRWLSPSTGAGKFPAAVDEDDAGGAVGELYEAIWAKDVGATVIADPPLKTPVAKP